MWFDHSFYWGQRLGCVTAGPLCSNFPKKKKKARLSQSRRGTQKETNQPSACQARARRVEGERTAENTATCFRNNTVKMKTVSVCIVLHVKGPDNSPGVLRPTEETPSVQLEFLCAPYVVRRAEVQRRAVTVTQLMSVTSKSSALPPRWFAPLVPRGSAEKEKKQTSLHQEGRS